MNKLFWNSVCTFLSTLTGQYLSEFNINKRFTFSAFVLVLNNTKYDVRSSETRKYHGWSLTSIRFSIIRVEKMSVNVVIRGRRILWKWFIVTSFFGAGRVSLCWHFIWTYILSCTILLIYSCKHTCYSAWTY